MSGVGTARLPDRLQERWQFKTGDAIEGAPAIAGDTAYVASFDKHLYALELASGKLRWKTRLGVMKAPQAVHKGRVYVGDLDGNFYCVDAANGQVLWKFQAGAEIHAGANFYKDLVIVGSHDSNLYCLDSTGKKVWSVSIDGPINAAAPVVGDLTFATGCSDGVLHIIDARSGKELDTLPLGGETVATAAVAGDHLYAAMISNQVVAVNYIKREKVWAFTPDRRPMPFYASPAVAEGIVVSGSRDRRVYALDARTGKELWNFATAGQVDAAPVIVGQRVYVGCLSNDGEFYVLDLKTGKKLQELLLDGPVGCAAAVGPDCLVVGTDRGTVYCLGGK